ncbi:MFS transporter [Actinomadura luteofluorescens]|uniref:MFS transporter n=1 Tax=Actinomadura luteofluorescens TaxID=46163 RepID=UPI00363F20E9
MLCLVYGFSNAASHSWGTPLTWGLLAAGVALLIVFAAWQARTAHPLLPPRIVLDRVRAGAYLTILVSGAGTFGVFLFLVYYMQVTLGYSAVRSGVAMLPMVVFSGAMAVLGNTRLMPRFGPGPMVIAGMLLNAAAMVWLTRIGAHSGYGAALLGPLMVIGAGMGLVFGMAAATGTFGVAPRDAGVASASINTGQQLGGSIGTALLNTIAASATSGYLARPRARTADAGDAPARGRPRLQHGVLVVRRHLRGRCRRLRRAPALRPADGAPAWTGTGWL